MPAIVPRDRVIILAMALAFFALGVGRPAYNWDVIGYVAAAYHADGLRGAELSARTFADIRAETGPDAFEAMIGAKPLDLYRKAVFDSPTSLEQQVPLYSIRTVYVQTLRLLKRAGLSYPRASYWVSAIFAAAAVAVLGFIAIEAGVAVGWMPLVAVVAGFPEIARISTPDSMACFLALLATYSALRGTALVFACSALLPLVRTDFVILAAALMAFEIWRGRRGLGAASAALAVGLMIATNAWHEAYGWKRMFNFAFISMSPFPAAMDDSMRLADYLRPYANLAKGMLVSQSAQSIVYFLALYAIVWRWRREAPSPALLLLLGIPVAFVLVHLVLFPLYWGRYFVPAMSLILVGLMRSVQPRSRENAQAAPALAD